jgi:hypothetical protein
MDKAEDFTRLTSTTTLDKIEDTIALEGSDVRPKSAINVPDDSDEISGLDHKAEDIIFCSLVFSFAEFFLIERSSSLARALFIF